MFKAISAALSLVGAYGWRKRSFWRSEFLGCSLEPY